MENHSSPNHNEVTYIKALSRSSTVEAYSNWNELSYAEQLCLENVVHDKMQVLDLGCGTGRIPYILGAKFDYYLGVDRSFEMIEVAKKQNPNFNFVCEDILSLNISDNKFDAVLMMNNVIDILNPVDRRAGIFSLVKSVLKPSGALIFSSHLLLDNSLSGYYKEDYHGATVETYKSSFSQICSEIEINGFDVQIALRDNRKGTANWAYFVVNNSR